MPQFYASKAVVHIIAWIDKKRKGESKSRRWMANPFGREYEKGFDKYNMYNELITRALEEDIGWGDITTASCVPADKFAAGKFIAKESMVVCGIETLIEVFKCLNEEVRVIPYVADGDFITKSAVIAAIEGPARAILTGERTALNLIQRLSGIATRTRQAVEAVAGTKAKITDTRKTTPCLRVLEKYAVRVGGGYNHRLGLSDGVLIKDNHIRAAGGIAIAVKNARDNAPHTLKIEVEADTLEAVREALEAGADIIMLDNMSIDEMREAVAIINGKAQTEASGNMGDKDLREVACIGVDIISIGALTHTVRAADISLKFEMKEAYC